VGNILTHGGTMLYTRRSERFLDPRRQVEAVQRARAAGIGTLVIIGGEGSIPRAHALARHGPPVAGAHARARTRSPAMACRWRRFPRASTTTSSAPTCRSASIPR